MKKYLNLKMSNKENNINFQNVLSNHDESEIKDFKSRKVLTDLLDK